MVSTLLLYLNFSPLRSTIPWSPFYFFILTSPPCVPLYNGLHSTSLFKLPPCVPLNHCLQSTSLFQLPPPAFHYTMLSILLFDLNFPAPALHHTIVSIRLLHFNFIPHAFHTAMVYDVFLHLDLLPAVHKAMVYNVRTHTHTHPSITYICFSQDFSNHLSTTVQQIGRSRDLYNACTMSMDMP